MGGGSYHVKDWEDFSAKRRYADPKTTVRDVYSKTTIDPGLDPKGFKFRESFDSIDNPESTPLIIGLDVTGSMDRVLDSIARKGLNIVCKEVYNRKPISNPHICVLGIGDVMCDRFPFQATQFEADIRINEQLEKLFLERGGGGNNYESYILAWYFACYRTKTHSFSKRGRKGFIFTIGDEDITPEISGADFNRHLGDSQVHTMTAKELFNATSQEWNIFHIVIKEGDNASRRFPDVFRSWEEIIGQHTIPLDDHTKLGEAIVSTLEMSAGKSLKETASSWDRATESVVNAALRGVDPPFISSPSRKAIESFL